MKKLLSISVFVLPVLFFILTPLPAVDNPDYSKLIGTWKNLDAKENYDIKMVFKPHGIYEEYLYYGDGGSLRGDARTPVWTGTGDYKVEYDVLVIRILHTSDNVRLHKSFHFVQFTDSKIILLDTATGRKSLLRRYHAK